MGIAETKTLEPTSVVAGEKARPAVHVRAPAWLPYLALCFGMLGISTSAIFIKWANVPGPVSGFYRMVIATSIIALPFAREARRRGPLSRHHLAIAALAGLFFAGDVASYGTAVLITSAANATLLGNTAPLWVGVAAMLLFRENLRPAFWGGLLLAMVGVFSIIGQDVLANPSLGAADMLGLVSGFCYGMFLLSTERARAGLASLVCWWVSAAASLVGLLVLSLLFGFPLIGYSLPTLLNLVALALMTQVVGWLSLNYALGHLRASVVAPTLLAQPIFTAVIAVPLLGQPLGMVQVVGGALVLGGIFIVHRTNAV
jgi:drug/metabolite transporter (DMT)-like permease